MDWVIPLRDRQCTVHNGEVQVRRAAEHRPWSFRAASLAGIRVDPWPGAAARPEPAAGRGVEGILHRSCLLAATAVNIEIADRARLATFEKRKFELAAVCGGATVDVLAPREVVEMAGGTSHDE